VPVAVERVERVVADPDITGVPAAYTGALVEPDVE
jgi:hypothetical protein